MNCQACGAALPDDARFCIECGAPAGPAASTGATVQLPRQAQRPGLACPSCGTANPYYAVYCVRCGQSMARAAPAAAAAGQEQVIVPADPTPQGRRRRQRAGFEGAEGVLFLIGLAALFLLKLPFWPGILIVAGLSAFVSQASRGRYYSGLSSVLWLFGLAFLFMVPRLWWPGILVIIGLNIVLDMLRRSLRRP